MDYRSLTILSRCLQAPVPNLGQFDAATIASSANHSIVPMSPSAVTPVATTPPIAALANQPMGVLEAPLGCGPVLRTNEACSPSGMPEFGFMSAAIDKPYATLPHSHLHDPPVTQCIPAQAVPEMLHQLPHTTGGPQFLTQQFPTSVAQPRNIDDDEFADFQAAPIGPSAKGASAATSFG
jgi:hypothetical protein